jgi:carbamoyl-phosphate synthase small subunit
MTYPIIGNYGISREDFESMRLQPCAFIVHELCDTPSNFRSTDTLENILLEFNIPCLSDVDTRSVVKRLRENGTMLGVITDNISDMARLMGVISSFKQIRLVESVSIEQKILLETENTGPSVALLDCGTKLNVGRSLTNMGCNVTQYPCFATAEEIIAGKHDALMLSNGPGNPEDCVGIIKEIRKLYDHGLPTLAICLGHQLLALATGGKTEKMKYGHRGANHPVKFLHEDRTYMSSQNHGYVVCEDGLSQNAEVNCINVNDKTVEGIIYHGKPIFTVQFHPEAAPGPHCTAFLFDRFLRMIKEGRYND